MSAREKSDLPEVAEKRANKVASAAAELVERRGGAKENAELQSTVRTQSREAVSQAQARIREAVNRNRQDKLTAVPFPDNYVPPNNGRGRQLRRPPCVSSEPTGCIKDGDHCDCHHCHGDHYVFVSVG